MDRFATSKALAATVLSAALLSGCGYEGLNSFTLPGTAGGDGYTVKLELENAMDLVPNSPVLVDDLKAGTVKSIELDGYQPVVTVTLKKDVRLPANATAKIGQTSLLGAKHVEINAPVDAEPTGELADGTTIPTSQTGTYPATEDVLASVSALLNGGGLAQIKTITTELNQALGGRTETVRSLLDQTNTFTASLDQQSTDIVKAIDSLNRLGGEFSAGNDTIAGALEALPPALDVLSAEREKLVRALESLGEFGVEADDLVTRAGDDLVTNIDNLAPAIRGLADAGPDLVEAFNLLPGVAFQIADYDEYLRGDYINLWATVDLGLDTLDAGLLTGTPLAGSLGGASGILGRLMTGNAGDLGNPLTDPLSLQAPGAAPGSGSDDASPDATTPPGQETADGAAPTQDRPSNGLSHLLGGLLGGGR